MAGTLIVNPRSGDGRPPVEELAEAAEALGVTVHVLEEGDDGAALARGASAGPVGTAGGDGSLAPVAAVCIERDLPFVCVPLGTRNHFARDLGLDRGDPLAALRAFSPDAVERRIDAGRAGGRLFLNNVSLGLYAGLVHDREARRRRREAFARLKALRRLAVDREPVELTLDGAPLHAHLLLVANNAYTPMQAFSAGERERLDEGTLCVYVGTEMLPRHWEERRAERVVVGSPTGTLRTAIDGEPAELAAPLELEVLPGALRVLVPGGENPRMSPRASSATAHELQRVGLLSSLPGETLGRLAANMVREEVPPGAAVVVEGEESDRFYVVLAGMLTVDQSSLGARRVLRPGDYFGEVAAAMGVPRTASVRALTPATLASCDRATFDELVRPLFSE